MPWQQEMVTHSLKVGLDWAAGVTQRILLSRHFGGNGRLRLRYSA
jgi:hypothetical protein